MASNKTVDNSNIQAINGHSLIAPITSPKGIIVVQETPQNKGVIISSQQHNKGTTILYKGVPIDIEGNLFIKDEDILAIAE